MEITFSIVGTSRHPSSTSFKAACFVAEELLKKFEQCNYPVTHLVAGGRAFAEHVAVKLFLDKKVPHLVSNAFRREGRSPRN